MILLKPVIYIDYQQLKISNHIGGNYKFQVNFAKKLYVAWEKL